MGIRISMVAALVMREGSKERAESKRAWSHFVLLILTRAGAR